MRGYDALTGSLFSYADLEQRVGPDHPLRAIRGIVNSALADLSTAFDTLYSPFGRETIPPERLLRALLLQALYSIRSERQLVERIEFDLLFRGFLGLIVDGTLLEAWASTKGFRPKDGFGPPPGTGRNEERNFHGQKRSNETHTSTTDPQPYCKGRGQEAKLAFMGHALMESRNGLIAGAVASHVSGHVERLGALHLIEPHADRPQKVTLAGDKGFDTQDFVAKLREINVTAHVAQSTNGRRSAIDGQTTRHTGYAISLRIQPSACASTSGLRRPSAGQRRWLGCARPTIAGYPMWTGSSPWQWPLTTWFACRSCW